VTTFSSSPCCLNRGSTISLKAERQTDQRGAPPAGSPSNPIPEAGVYRIVFWKSPQDEK